ncbi:MAG TPA: tetratricopeptide repeat protein [Phototrophicaceae bacterium]|nr:tetratricopeptide repeat protein [Phototrophicaceae bacterium]
MRKLILLVGQRFQLWERPVQISFILALGLLLLTFVAVAFGPLSLRQPALIGGLGLVIVAQVIFMWANRNLVLPYTQAQRYYLAEDFPAAQQILETVVANGKADFRALTLLGNTYRQLGRLDESQEVLTKALAIRPSDPFPLYGFGRTLLIKGFYAEAADVINRALVAGAPVAVKIDLGEALYRQGQKDEARSVFQNNQLIDCEPYRKLMMVYLLHCLGAGEPPPRELLKAGLPFWRQQVERFETTPYGQILAADVQQMQALIEET